MTGRWRHPLRKTLLAAALAFSPVPALAHAFLTSAAPAVGSTLHRAPTSVSITFTEAVEPAFSQIAVTDAQGRRVDHGPPQLAPKGSAHRSATLLVPLESLAPGGYTVAWHATSVDTHKTSGRFVFTVAP